MPEIKQKPTEKDVAERRVWVPNEGQHRYESAREFGELVFMSKNRVNVFSIDNLTAMLVSQVKDTATKNDFVLISGYAVVNSIVIHFFLKKFGFVRLLTWEGNKRKYCVLTLHDFEL